MKYQEMTTKDLLEYQELRSLYPNSSIPKEGIEIILNYHAIALTPIPDYDSTRESVRELEPINYVQTWEVFDLPQEIIDENINQENTEIRDSMIAEGKILGIDNGSRTTVGASPSIEDEAEYNQWMKDLYNNLDGLASAELYKPPSTERQKLEIDLEDTDKYKFTRYQDEWGWRWYLKLERVEVNALSIAIYDANGNYLYTPGAMLQHLDGGWYTECPAGSASANPDDVYYKWLLGSKDISGLEVYRGSDEYVNGVVRSDERYDMD